MILIIFGPLTIISHRMHLMDFTHVFSYRVYMHINLFPHTTNLSRRPRNQEGKNIYGYWLELEITMLLHHKQLSPFVKAADVSKCVCKWERVKRAHIINWTFYLTEGDTLKRIISLRRFWNGHTSTSNLLIYIYAHELYIQ